MPGLVMIMLAACPPDASAKSAKTKPKSAAVPKAGQQEEKHPQRK